MSDTSRADTFRGHVRLATNICLCDRGDQVSTDTEVANLDGTSGVDQNIRRLDVAVNDVVFVLERFEAACCCESDLAEDILRYTVTIQLVH